MLPFRYHGDETKRRRQTLNALPCTESWRGRAQARAGNRPRHLPLSGHVLLPCLSLFSSPHHPPKPTPGSHLASRSNDRDCLGQAQRAFPPIGETRFASHRKYERSLIDRFSPHWKPSLPIRLQFQLRGLHHTLGNLCIDLCMQQGLTAPDRPA